MRDDFKDLLALEGTPEEQAWVKERLETLSVRESYALSAALTRRPAVSAWDAAVHLQSLNRYEILFPAGSYEQLGELYLWKETRIPRDAMPYVNLERLGQQYEDMHPGLFIGDCYVTYPAPADPQCVTVPRLEDNDWSVKLKLASPAVPEGVWVRLPGRDGRMPEDSEEIGLARHELKTKILDDCTLLEARCILPEAEDLLKQYDSITELVRDGDELGYVLAGLGQVEDHCLEKFAAALEYEDCRTLRFALDIFRNLECYEWVPREDLAISAEGLLLDAGVPNHIIHSGCIDLSGYKAHLLESAGYMQASGETGYLLRNEREFVREYIAPEQGGMTMQ